MAGDVVGAVRDAGWVDGAIGRDVGGCDVGRLAGPAGCDAATPNNATINQRPPIIPSSCGLLSWQNASQDLSLDLLPLNQLGLNGRPGLHVAGDLQQIQDPADR